MTEGIRDDMSCRISPWVDQGVEVRFILAGTMFKWLEEHGSNKSVEGRRFCWPE